MIPVRGATDVLRGQLAALARQECSVAWDVIIADNGADDGLAAMVSEFDGALRGLRVVDARDRRGASHARNRGAHTS